MATHFFSVVLVQLQSGAALQTLLKTDERLMQKHQSAATPAQAAEISGPFGPATIDECIPDRGCSTKPWSTWTQWLCSTWRLSVSPWQQSGYSPVHLIATSSLPSEVRRSKVTSAQYNNSARLSDWASVLELWSVDEAGLEQLQQSFMWTVHQIKLFVSWVGAQHLSFLHSLRVCSVVLLRSHQSSSRHPEQNVAFVSAMMQDCFLFSIL